MPKEEWRPVQGFEGIYEVSNRGGFRTLEHHVTFPWNGREFTKLVRARIHKQHLTDRGYVKLTLKHKGIQTHEFVHRMVARAFIPNPHNLPVVNHLNSNRADNRVENLEWCTLFDNIQHGIKYGQGHHYGELHGRSILTDEGVLSIRSRLAQGHSVRSLAEEYRVSDTTIYKVKLGQSWTHLLSTGSEQRM